MNSEAVIVNFGISLQQSVQRGLALFVPKVGLRRSADVCDCLVEWRPFSYPHKNRISTTLICFVPLNSHQWHIPAAGCSMARCSGIVLSLKLLALQGWIFGLSLPNICIRKRNSETPQTFRQSWRCSVCRCKEHAVLLAKDQACPDKPRLLGCLTVFCKLRFSLLQ